jgi:hypothetical protein
MTQAFSIGCIELLRLHENEHFLFSLPVAQGLYLLDIPGRRSCRTGSTMELKHGSKHSEEQIEN